MAEEAKKYWNVIGRQILGDDLWEELETFDLVCYSPWFDMHGLSQGHMKTRLLWTVAVHENMVIRAKSGERWMPTGSGRTPEFEDFLDHTRGHDEFALYLRASYTAEDIHSIEQEQRAREQAKKITDELIKDEESRKAALDKKTEKNRKKKEKKRAKMAELASSKNAEGSSEKESEITGVFPVVPVVDPVVPVVDPVVDDSNLPIGSTKNQVEEASNLSVEAVETANLSDKRDVDISQVPGGASNTNPWYMVRDGKRICMDDIITKIMAGIDSLKSDMTKMQAEVSNVAKKSDMTKMQAEIQKEFKTEVRTVHLEISMIKKDLKAVHLDVSSVCESSGRSILQAFAEDYYAMPTAVPLPMKLLYSADDELETLAKLCPPPFGESGRCTPLKADIDCYVAFKGESNCGQVLIGEITRSDLLINPVEYVQPTSDQQTPTPSSKLLYKLIQLERGVRAVEQKLALENGTQAAITTPKYVKAAVLASTAFRDLSPPQGRVLLKQVLDANANGRKLKALEFLHENLHLHTLAL